jgi:hypothetical protein
MKALWGSGWLAVSSLLPFAAPFAAEQGMEPNGADGSCNEQGRDGNGYDASGECDEHSVHELPPPQAR